MSGDYSVVFVWELQLVVMERFGWPLFMRELHLFLRVDSCDLIFLFSLGRFVLLVSAVCATVIGCACHGIMVGILGVVSF